MRTQKHCETRSPAQSLTLWLVGEHPLILEALKLYFGARRRYRVVPCVLDLNHIETHQVRGLKGQRTRRGSTPDVAIVDAARTLFGMRATQYLLETFPETKVIGLTAPDDRSTVLNLIRAGAHGCLIKACSPAELFRSIDTVLRGDSYFSADISKMIQREFVNDQASVQQRICNGLNSSEQRLLEFIADGMSNKQMAGELNISVRTIEKYRESLMAKLGIHTVAGLTKFAVRQGISRL